MFIINLQGKEPIYDQIKKQILRYIQLGILNPNDKLPSIRQLAESLGINPNTVAKAYQQLENEHVVYTMNKKGVFVSGELNRESEKQEVLMHIKEILFEGKKSGISKDEIQSLLVELYEEDDYA